MSEQAKSPDDRKEQRGSFSEFMGIHDSPVKIRKPGFRAELLSQLGFESSNKLILIKQIRKGVNVAALDTLAERLSVPVKDVSRYVDISVRTLSRRKQVGLLNSEESERVFRVGSLIVRAEEVLSDHDEAIHWLKTPKKALGGQIPLELADTEVGANEVKDLLGRIEHGVFS